MLCTTRYRRLKTTKNRLRGQLVVSKQGTTNEERSTQVDNGSTIRIDMGLTSINAGNRDRYRNKHIQAATARHNNIALDISTLRTNGSNSISR